MSPAWTVGHLMSGDASSAVATAVTAVGRPIEAETADELAADLQDLDALVIEAGDGDAEVLAAIEAVQAGEEDLPIILIAHLDATSVANEALRRGITELLPYSVLEEDGAILRQRLEDAIEEHGLATRADHLERIHRVVSEINQALVRADSAEEIDRRVCAIISESAPYRFAWIGTHDREAGHVIPRAWAGPADEYLDGIEITTGDEATAMGPTGTAVRTGEIAVAQDIVNDPDFEPWREVALDHGFRSSAAIPLLHEGTLHGVLNVYADRPHAFDANEGELLGLLGDTIAYALHDRAVRNRLRRRTLAVEQAADAIFITDTDGTIEYVNPAFEALTGYETDEAVGSTPRILKSGEQDDAYYGRMWEAILGGAVWEEQITNLRRDGEPYVAEQTIAPLIEDDGRLDGFVAIQRDITARVAQAEALESSRDRLRVLFDGAPDAIIVHDVEGNVLDVNQTMVERTGYPRDELLSMHVNDFEVGLDHESLRVDWASMETGSLEKLDVEGRHQRQDGSTFPVEVWVSRISDGEGRDRFLAIARDITDRKAREHELEVFRRAVEEAGHAVFITDREGVIKYVNPVFEEQTGYDAESVIGEDPRILRSDVPDPSIYRAIWETIQSGQVWAGETMQQRRDGALYHVQQVISPITDEHGEVSHFVTVQSDITGRHLREQRLAVLTRILRHNVRNAMNIVEGYAREIETHTDNPAVIESVDTIDRTAMHLLELAEQTIAIQEILDEPTPDSPSVELRPLLETLRTDLVEARPTAEVSVSAPPDVQVATDDRIQAAIREAMFNAVDHNDQATPRVDVTVTVPATDDRPGRVVVEVADNGPGIPATERKAISRREESPLVHGEAIGLWLIQWITQFFGGMVEVRENDPRGSVVRLELPLVETDEQQQHPA